MSRLKADVRRLSSASGTSHRPPAAQPEGQSEAGMYSAACRTECERHRDDMVQGSQSFVPARYC